jgi:hypothetical protein
MLPELNDEQLRDFKSRAEARFYEECRRQLPNDILVIYSATWLYRDGRGYLREGEADFTIIVPQSGIFTIEVKGGGVSFDAASGRWCSIDRNGRTHDIKDPFRQASNERHAIRDQLLGHQLWRRWRGTRVTLGHAVMLPDIKDARQLLGPDRQREVIGIDEDLTSLVPWLDRLIHFWRQELDDQLGGQGLQLAEEILCRSVEVRPALRNTLDDTDRQRLRLTNNQAKILRIIGGRMRAVISGGAGTGKTLIGVEKARELAQTGLSVLLLCYNRPLADALSAGLQDEAHIRVLSFHQLCDQRIAAAKQVSGRNLLEEAEAAYPGSSANQVFNVQMPYALALSNELLDEKYDALIVDEAQDFSDDYWFSLEELLRSPEAGHLYIFIDENQALYRRHANLPVEDVPYHLTANCRNTSPIHQVGYAYYKGESVDEPELHGHAVQRVAVEGDMAQAEAVVAQVRHLLADGVRPEDIVVLLAKRPKARMYQLLQANRLPSGIAWAIEAPGRRGTVFAETVGRFKGLEAQAVVLWLGDEVIDEAQWELVYVGTTRAKSLLCIVGSPRLMQSLK